MLIDRKFALLALLIPYRHFKQLLTVSHSNLYTITFSSDEISPHNVFKLTQFPYNQIDQRHQSI